MARRRLFAGEQLKALRTARKLRQGEMAALLGISASYLSQIENDERPLTPALTDRLQQSFPVEWQDFAADRVEPVLSALRDAQVYAQHHGGSLRQNRLPRVPLLTGPLAGPTGRGTRRCRSLAAVSAASGAVTVGCTG